MKKLSIEFSTIFDTLLKCEYGAYELASGTVPSSEWYSYCVIYRGIFSSEKEFKEISKECRNAKTDEDLRAIVSKLKLTDPRISISFQSNAPD